MKFILDTNSLNKHIINRAAARNDICTIQDVEDEHTSYGSNPSRVQSSGVEVVQIRAKHLRSLQELLITEGANFDLIRLYTSEGTADVMILAFILAERQFPETLFPDEYTIVTRDKGLTAVAAKNNIPCLTTI